MEIDLGIFLVDDMLVKTDRASMANSLEARVPILDTVVSDFALSLSPRTKVRGLGFQKKRILRRAVAPLLPEPILRGKKRGFSIPLAAWLRGELAPLAHDVLSPSNLKHSEIFHTATVTRLLDDHISGRADYSRKLWTLLVFALWFERYASGSYTLPEAPAVSA